VKLDILNFEQTELFIVLHISIWGRGLKRCFGEAKPTKNPHGSGTVWQTFSLLFHAIDSEKYLGYAICQDLSNFLFISMTGPKWHITFR